jgi:hypothetical protein
MPRRLLARVLLVASCALVTLLARRAHAAVPFCDERGATGLAPIPALPVRDIRLEAPFPLPLCPDPSMLLELEPPRSERGGTAPPVDESLVEPCSVPPSPLPDPHAACARASWSEGASLAARAGHARGVFHPPR